MFKQVTLTNKCLAIVMQRNDNERHSSRHRSANTRSSPPENGFRIFQEFQEENRASFWNPGLVQSVNALEFVGFVRPGTLFVSGNEIHLECLRGAWARRVLKSPPGFTIKGLGDIGGIEMQEVPQTQFIPLPEVLCLIVSNLNRVGKPATLSEIVSSLMEDYDGMCIPKEEVLYATLGALIAEGKLYCMGEHYFIPTPTMFHYYQRQFLHKNSANQPMWNTENGPRPGDPLYKSSGVKVQETCSRECQTGASVVCGQAPYMPPTRDQATNAQGQPRSHAAVPPGGVNGRPQRPTKLEVNKEIPPANKENRGFLSRLFGRSKPRHLSNGQSNGTKNVLTPVEDSEKPSTATGQHPSASVPSAVPLATFSAQFPPPEWLCDPRLIKAVASKDTTQGPAQEPFLTKVRRTCKQQQPLSSREQHRHSVWVDPIDGSGHGRIPHFNNRRERSNEVKHRFASQRYHDHRHGHLSPNEHNDRYCRPKQRHRLSKYLSSSSECLRQSPYQNKKNMLEEKMCTSHHHNDRHRQQHYSAYQFANDQQLLSSNEARPTGFATASKAQERNGKLQSAKTAMVVISKIPPLALPTDAEFDSVSESCGQMTSTPTPRKQHAKILPVAGTKNTAENGQMNQLSVDGNGRNRDSAYSASPVVTEMSSSSGKYSSWSGSDGHRDNGGTVAAANSPQSQTDHKSTDNDHARLVIDNTYVNDTQTRLCVLDHTYQNLDHQAVVKRDDNQLDGTRYENVSNVQVDNTAIVSKQTNAESAVVCSKLSFISSV